LEGPKRCFGLHGGNYSFSVETTTMDLAGGIVTVYVQCVLLTMDF
jgi:hypothetical protein